MFQPARKASVVFEPFFPVGIVLQVSAGTTQLVGSLVDLGLEEARTTEKQGEFLPENIAMENHHAINGNSTINVPFSIAMLNYQRGYINHQ